MTKPDLFDFSMFLKPILLMNGVKDFHIHFDIKNRKIVMTGLRWGEKLLISQTFAEIEMAINGPAATEDSKTAIPGGQTPGRGEIDDPGRS